MITYCQVPSCSCSYATLGLFFVWINFTCGGSHTLCFLGIVKAFRKRVDEALPGMYTWFQDDSLHVTLRALL